jgi:nitrite reductase (NADH) large subunit
LAKDLDIAHDKGIQVDERLRKSRPEIYAAGDVAEYKGMLYGIWPASMEQGRIAGINMAGRDALYPGTTMANTLKVVGIDLASAGEIDAESKFQSRVLSEGGVYKKVVMDQNRVIGCIMLGDTDQFGKVVKAISEKKDAAETVKMIFGTLA